MRLAKVIGKAAVLAFLLCGTAPLAASEPPSLTAEQARQCALWASFVAAEITQSDPEGAQAMNMATNYFAGYYEGKSGRSLASGGNQQEAQALVDNIDAVTETCLAQMVEWGDRMLEWGNALEAAAQAGDTPVAQ